MNALNLDYLALHAVNVDYAHPIMDHFWLTITQLHKLAWFNWAVLPLLVAMVVYIYRRNAWRVGAALIFAVGVSDVIAYRVIKTFVHRQRPFQNSEISDWVRKVGEAHGASFPSNHAANVWAGALVLAWFFPRLRYWFYIFATLVTVSRVALGVHYPSDALAGMILGIIVGYLVRALILNHYPVSNSDENSPAWRTRYRRMR